MRGMRALVALLVVAGVSMGARWQRGPDFSGQWVAEPEVPTAAAPGKSGTAPGPPPTGNIGSGWGSPITIKQDVQQLVIEHPCSAAMTCSHRCARLRNAGRLADCRRKAALHEFEVAGKKHFVVGAGDYASWDGASATRDLAAIVGETYRFWGVLPYEKYLFLLMFRQGGGGLEHKNSNLSTVRANMSETTGRWSALGLLSHEYFHLFNVKRLRPIELGPFDFEKPPTTGSLWISEGVTSYFSDLMIVRAGLQTPDAYLASLSSLIGRLQTAPGRLKQSVEQSSREVWANNSGINPDANTVSYYNKGAVLGLLLDAKIRRATSGRRALDDVLRQAYQRYSGDRGFTDQEFRATAAEVAGADLQEWFRKSVSSTEELDYTDVLEWYGLRFTSSAGAAGEWTLQPREDATEAQKGHLGQWLASSR